MIKLDSNYRVKKHNQDDLSLYNDDITSKIEIILKAKSKGAINNTEVQQLLKYILAKELNSTITDEFKMLLGSDSPKRKLFFLDYFRKSTFS